jgi:hypothetical protein
MSSALSPPRPSPVSYSISPAPLSSSSSSHHAISISSPASWDELRKTARKLESTIYSKLCEFSQSVNEFVQSNSTGVSRVPLINSSVDPNSSDSESSALLPSSSQSSSSLTLSLSLESELESLLHSLSLTSEDMANFVQNSLTGNSSQALDSHGLSSSHPSLGDSNSYTLQRYKAILHDYSLEFNKTKETLNSAKLKREMFLRQGNSAGNTNNSVDASAASSPTSSGIRPRNEPLNREKDKILNSVKMADQVLQQAEKVKSVIYSQGQAFRQIGVKMALIAQRFPLVNSLVGRIRLYKNRDSLIIAAVIAALLLFSLIYWMSKS